MYRTDKQFMKNPATASSRIYVGALPKTVVADDLEAKFRVHGKILGLVLNQGFAFIQFENDHEAQQAIARENMANMHGRKIVVKQAVGKNDNKPGMNQNQNKPPALMQQRNQGPPPRQNFGGPPPKPAPPPQNPQNAPPVPVVEKQSEKDLKFEPPENPNDDAQDEEMDTGPNIRPPPPQQQNDFDEGTPRNTRGKRGGRKMRGRSNDRFDSTGRDFPERGGGGAGFYGAGGRSDFIESYGPPIEAVPVVAHPPDRNDCEIIVVARTLTEYAEFIESKLKQLGLIVDLLFPNEDVPIGRVLANISSRGCLYAILVMPQNEEHRSLTLNVLHGLPQEHRNMPIEDAMLLISRNFEAYMRGDKVIPEDPLKMTLADRHPVPIQMIFNLLAENRQLTTAQYDRIIKYLQERRQLQSEYEGVEGMNQDTNESNKEAELQNRIMNILNKSEEPPIPVSITNPEPPANNGAPTPLLKDPTVQKALDSLVLGDIFKNIAA